MECFIKVLEPKYYYWSDNTYIILKQNEINEKYFVFIFCLL